MFPHLYDDLADAEAMVVFRAGGGIFDTKYLHASSSVGNAISVRRKKTPITVRAVAESGHPRVR